MTTFGPGSGYSDWERVSSLLSHPMVNQSLTFTVATLNFGPFYIGAYPTTRVAFVPVSSDGTSYVVTFSFYADQALTQLISTFAWRTGNAVPVYDAIGNIGPWLVVTVLTNGFPNAFPPMLAVVATTAPVEDSRCPPSKALVTQALVAIAASGVMIVQGGCATSGSAVMMAYSAITTWNCLLTAVDGAGNVAWLNRIVSTQSNPSSPYLVYLPGGEITMTFTNGTTTAGTFSMSLVML